jgi:hypothetical protein
MRGKRGSIEFQNKEKNDPVQIIKIKKNYGGIFGQIIKELWSVLRKPKKYFLSEMGKRLRFFIYLQ